VDVTYFPRFVFPWALVLVALVPWSIYVGAKIRSLSTGRKWTAIALRSLILLCLIAALAGAELVKKTDKLAVFFLLDQSSSIPGEVCLASAQAVRQAAEAYMTVRDEAGVIVFGEEASIELTVGPNVAMGEVQSYVGGEQTDLAGAVRLAMAAFPQGYMKRIVVYSDGNETRGAALEEVKLAQASGVAVDVVPLSIGGANEVRVRELATPGRVNAGEPFHVQVVVHADQDCEGTLRLYQRVDRGKRLLAEQPVTLQEGDNSFLLPQELGGAGFYEYMATVDSDADTVLANNEGQAYTIIQGEPRVLYLEADPEHSTFLAPALRSEGLDVVQASLGEMPASLAQFQNYDVVILSDVSSTDMSSAQLKAFQALVRDLGIGLVMIGGPNSFGAGGYHNTPLERALPVDMDIKQRKILPRGALALILHTCEIGDGNAWARDIGIAALEVLSSRDLMGALAYGGRGEDWVFPLQPVGDKTQMRAALRAAMPGDMPDVGSTLGMAYQALRQANAAVKRVIIISDGDPQPPPGSLLKALAGAKISVSTVCIGPHGFNDQNMLKWIAKSTGGNYYYVTDPTKLPQIFTKEAAVVRKGILVEEPFTPKVRHDSELLQGIADTGLPQLTGYITTSPKDSATVPLVSHEDDPVLAHWRHGLGKSVAFTSDVTSRWAAGWLAWEGFNRFWAQAVRWAMRDTEPTSFRVDTRVKDGRGYVRIDAVDEQGKFVNFLRPRGVVTGPAPDFGRVNLSLLQTAPGIYEGAFPLDDRGVYMVHLMYERGDGGQGMIPAGLALGYSREYEYNTTNRGLLEQLAAVGGGKVRDPYENVFQHDLVAAATVTPVWPHLAATAACLFPVEIFVRRVVIDARALLFALAALLRKLPALRRWIPAPARKPVVATGSFAGSAPSPDLVYAAAGPTRTGVVSAYAPASSDRRGALDTPTAAEAEEQVEPPPEEPVGRSEYTSKLLQAKQRALEKRTRRTGDRDGDEKEES